MGGEALGARTHGGHVPPHRPAGLRDGSTASVIGAHPKPGTALSWAWIGREVGESIGIAGKNRPKVGEEPRPGG